MVVYRIQKTKYALDISGIGSTRVSGRWHLAGQHPILYTSANISLAILEYLVHLPSSVKPPSLTLLTLNIPDHKIVTADDKDLPSNWQKKGYVVAVQQWGSAWLARQSSLALKVPSVISPDYNVLVNPRHRDFQVVRIVDSRPITLDDRLI